MTETKVTGIDDGDPKRFIEQLALASSLNETLACVLAQGLAASRMDRAFIVLLDAQMRPMHSLVDGTPGDYTALFPHSTVLIERAIAQRKALVIPDVHSSALFAPASDLQDVVCSVVVLPLLIADEVMGVIYLDSRSPASPVMETSAWWEDLSRYAPFAISKARIQEDLSSRLAALAAFSEEQGRQLGTLESALDRVRVAQSKLVIDGLTGIYNHTFFKEKLFNATKEAERYGHALSVVLVDLDHFKQVNQDHGHQAGDEVLRQVAATLRSLIRECDVLARYGGGEMAVLLPQTDRAGAVVLAHRLCIAINALQFTPGGTGEPFSPTASLGVASFRQGLTAAELIDLADGALKSAKQSGRNQVRAEGDEAASSPEEAQDEWIVVQSSMIDAVAALSEAVLMKDGSTGEHSKDMVSLAAALAAKIGIRGPMSKEIEVACLLHDVGKVGVPEGILQKAGPLEEREWSLMRKHPVLGARILTAANLPSLARAIRHHHERWDGSGYPDQLEGTEIPVAARIIAVVDAWCAMISTRPYTKALTREQALAELKRCAGTQFDPDVVEHFIEVLETAPATPESSGPSSP